MRCVFCFYPSRYRDRQKAIVAEERAKAHAAETGATAGAGVGGNSTPGTGFFGRSAPTSATTTPTAAGASAKAPTLAFPPTPASCAMAGGRQVIKDLSFTCKAGTTTAIVGHTGSGKSTLSRLLFRFYDVRAWRMEGSACVSCGALYL